jgi:NAD-dependent SIR2 family protein deacetylase
MSSHAADEMPLTDVASFAQHLQSSRRIVALLGAGLSASSGLPTFRGAGGLWRTFDATMLATPEAFERDPGLSWQFYSYRRHMALNAKPNRAHLALAELARRNPNFITLSQNVDGLSPRAGHPANQLKLLHGNLFDVKCWDEDGCGYSRKNDFSDPIVPALALPAENPDSGLKAAAGKKKHALLRGADISDVDVDIPELKPEDLPQCPSCHKNLLRPGVVWFGESLPEDVMSEVNEYFSNRQKIDLMMVIGTSAKVYPAAGYTNIARAKGARVAVINMDRGDARELTKNDWFFEGDAAVIVPDILKTVIGEIEEFDNTKGPAL